MNNKGIKINDLDSGNIFGTMNGGTIKLSNLTRSDISMLMHRHNLKSMGDYELTKEDKSRIFKKHREDFGYANGFDGRKMFMADQNFKKTGVRGNFFEITNEYVEQNPNGWTDIDEDILVMRDNVVGVAIGHPVADCPVVRMTDGKQGITAVAHCSAELIDQELPMHIVKVLTDNYDSKIEDIDVYVGAKAGKSWTYDKKPAWANNAKVWKNSLILEDDGLYHIDLETALIEQFIRSGLDMNKVVFNPIDTRLDANHYSHSMSYQDQNKFGRQFEGVIYQETETPKTR